MGPGGGAGAAVTLYAMAGMGGWAPRPPSGSLLNGIALSIFSPSPPPQRGRKRTDAVCVSWGGPQNDRRGGRNKTDRWREEGEGEGGGAVVAFLDL